MGVTAITSEDDFKAQLEKAGDKLVVVDFHATWCGPCKVIAPKIEEFSNKYDGIFLKVDVDDVPEVAESYKIEAMPTFLYIKNGKVVETVVGASGPTIETAIKKHIS